MWFLFLILFDVCGLGLDFSTGSFTLLRDFLINSLAWVSLKTVKSFYTLVSMLWLSLWMAICFDIGKFYLEVSMVDSFFALPLTCCKWSSTTNPCGELCNGTTPLFMLLLLSKTSYPIWETTISNYQYQGIMDCLLIQLGLWNVVSSNFFQLCWISGP